MLLTNFFYLIGGDKLYSKTGNVARICVQYIPCCIHSIYCSTCQTEHESYRLSVLAISH